MSAPGLQQLRHRARLVGTGAKVLTRAGVIRPHGPSTLWGLLSGMHAHGLGLAGAFHSAVTRFPDRVAIIDERGEATYAEIDQRSNAIADVLVDAGVREGDGVALLARNHRGFVEAAVATVKLGADVLLLNTSFSGPQLREVAEREKTRLLIHDQEFSALAAEAGLEVPRMLSWRDLADNTDVELETLDQAAERGARDRRRAPSRVGRTVILTSGTTGTPKGAPRGEAHLDVPVGLLERIPLRSGGRSHLAAPMFHFWGLGQFELGLMLGSTFVVTRRFDPLGFLDTVRQHDCDAAVVIPVMLQRILALPDSDLDGRRMASLRVVAASGSALPGELAADWMDRFGDNLYNTYGSTEVSLVSVATPADMRAQPGTAGRPSISTTVRLLDDSGLDVAPGETGRVFAGNSMLFEGYTGGGHKEQVAGLMSTGDVGYFDDDGRLVIAGRDDDMIVSGGENVFPQEVEDCIARHPAVSEVAAIGVDDDDFGQRLRAFVVPAGPGGDLDEDAVRDHVKSNLARYKVPRDIVFLSELPRNATGKVLKRELAEHRSEDT